MTKRLFIKAKSFKDFLNLFDKTLSLEDLSLGDTWHPSDGYVDEAILNGQRRIDDILKFPYEFIGLVFFECKIDGLLVTLNAGQFEVKGIDYKLRHLTNKIIEFNAETPSKYEHNITEF